MTTLIPKFDLMNGGSTPTGAVNRPINEKLAETVSVKDFGAKGNGSDNDTLAIQAAINASSAVYFPTGTYLSDTITLKSNSFLFGNGSATVIKQNTITGASYGTLFADSGSSSTTIDNITIRDMQIQSPNIVTPVFSQFQHLVSLNGVKNVLIENVDFIGFYGDGLLIGSGTIGGQERHNTNVVVRSCFFDGINKQNRNGISVIDCDGMVIDGNYFTRTTKSTMPGAIDIEPDSYTFHIVKDFKIINNKFYDIGGNLAAIAITLPAITYTTPPNGFIIENNFVDTFSANGFSFVYRLSGGISELTYNFGLFVSNNTFKNGAQPFSLFGAKDAVIYSNQFLNFTGTALIGYNTVNEKCINVSLLDNLFYYCGTSGAGIGLAIGTVSRLNIKGNEFNDCGTGVAGSANAIDFNVTASSSSVSIIENNFVSPNGKTLVAIQVESTHTLSPQTNIYSNNRLNGLANSFVWQIGDVQTLTYTPTDLSGAGLTFPVVDHAYYTKVGKLVTVNFYIAFPVTTNTNNVAISLPTGYAAAYYDVGVAQSNSTTIVSSCVTVGGTNAINLRTSTLGYLTNLNLSGSSLLVSITYSV
jgi:hypothetical protein